MDNVIIDKSRMKRHPLCFAYTANGWVETDDTKVYRFITSEKSENILDSEFFKCKQDIYWPRIKKVNKQPEDSPLQSNDMIKAAYDTDFITHVSKSSEWAPQQFLDALRLICDISIYCIQNNLFLSGHMGNVTLTNGKPIYIDIGDFHERGGIKRFALEYGLEIRPNKAGYFIPPSRFFDNWEFIRDEICEITEDGIATIVKYQQIKQILKQAQLADRCLKWSHYVKGDIPTNLGTLRTKNNNKHIVIYDTIMEKRPKTLTDLGCNVGIYSFLAESVGAKVVGIDKYSEVVERANKAAVERKANCVFLRFDIMNPPIPVIFDPLPKECIFSETSNKRLRSEGVLAAALIHHLYWQGYAIEDIIRVISSYATKWLLMEIIPTEDQFVKNTEWAKKWFTFEQIQDLLKQQEWKTIKIMDSTPLPRKWFLCER